ncbi:formate--tetrahydrofolate ligase [Saccharibacillus sp. CPCC 101409]|uniref:formate--tetrahydrofolate ligase n=1 Tax=Saccharibacillus sp. CPCC 101409 TaxID=3058041 RepID=UPI002671F874|nr:formate--tetrahydrofolate ligase [Saccharibacillus sp. CPCC 101409]MDO3409992.1 formate--tetrahydrofolate ligase [Saccharibacillus sp. CPCC 101409]
MRPIYEVAAGAGIDEEHLELYGRYKAKLNPSLLHERKDRPDGRLVLVTAVNPTPAGEGKTLTTIGLAQALCALGTNTVAALREPSLGPCFGMKGGATGGGRAQIVPAEDINLHFTGDLHAISSAHNLLSALTDNHIYHGNALELDPKRIVWKRAVDMNDRGLRSIVTGLGAGNGLPQESGFLITSASEVMAVLCLSEDAADLKERLGRMIVGYNTAGEAVTAADLNAVEGMAILLKDAIKPNLVQTLDGTPVIVHGGPFANIAHGCSSVIGTKTALKLGDVVVTEAGFGAELGAEKFFDIKCRQAGLAPDAAVLVVTAKALKYNGGAPVKELGAENPEALTAGLGNLRRHLRNLKMFGVPVLVAVNHFAADRESEIALILDACRELGVPAELSDVWADGAAGGEALARTLLRLLDEQPGAYAPLYDAALPLRGKIETIATRLYGGEGVSYAPGASKALAEFERLGFGHLPVCMAKTPYSFSDRPSLLGAPEGFTVGVSRVSLSAGAGFVVVETGSTMTMPGLPKVPAAERMQLEADGTIEGLM